jgi:hypothetical protein
MPLFNVTAWCDREFYTQFEVETDTPEQALAIAKERAEHEPAEECDDSYPWDTFHICDDEDNSLLIHRDDQAKLREAAPKLLAALEAGHNKSWVHNAAITQDIEALRRIALEQADWWNNIAWPLIEALKKLEAL